MWNLIETALTLKNVDTRSIWEQIYFHVAKRVLGTVPEEVNKKSLMVVWSNKLRNELEGQDFSKLLKAVKQKLPSKSEAVKLILKEGYCMLARYCHFRENICE